MKSIETPDKQTVTFTFDKSNAQFLQATSTMSLSFYSSDTLAKSPEERCTGDIVGTGPFQVKSFEHNKSIELARFDDYDWPSSIAEHEGRPTSTASNSPSSPRPRCATVHCCRGR